MRSEREMLELIVNTAEGDDRIRAVILNGSRANPDPPPNPSDGFTYLMQLTDGNRIAAGRVAARFGFDYPVRDDENVSAHLRHVRRLPRNADEMY